MKNASRTIVQVRFSGVYGKAHLIKGRHSVFNTKPANGHRRESRRNDANDMTSLKGSSGHQRKARIGNRGALRALEGFATWGADKEEETVPHPDSLSRPLSPPLMYNCPRHDLSATKPRYICRLLRHSNEWCYSGLYRPSTTGLSLHRLSETGFL